MNGAGRRPNWLKYTVFRTKWGYFGLAGTESALWRTCLPQPDRKMVESRLLKDIGSTNSQAVQYDRILFKALQEQIIAYFEGACVDFGPALPVALDGFRPFTRSVLNACRRIRFGRTAGYSVLAQMVGRPNASRAVGNALAKNPMPLIIPCHRVIRSDGSPGGFSAPGGLSLKRRLVLHEQNCQQPRRLHR
jgi:methylated-DNA-[protein]-cysteine S-methyltransferase